MRGFIVGLIGVALSCVMSSAAMAQWRPHAIRPVRSVDRWLGIGYGNGYHWKNPGTHSEHYHPYSDVNSGISQEFGFPQTSGYWPANSPSSFPSNSVWPVSVDPEPGTFEVPATELPAARTEAGLNSVLDAPSAVGQFQPLRPVDQAAGRSYRSPFRPQSPETGGENSGGGSR